MRRILVIGTSGSGKSTLAKRLAERLHLPFFPSDHFYWEAGWKLARPEKVRQQVMDVLKQEAWILDGNFDDEHELVWKQADCLIWLDYSLPTILVQVLTRNFRWLITRQQTWSGNRMTLKRAVSGIRHTIKSYALKKETYPGWLGVLPEMMVCRFRTKRETERWLQSLDRQ